MYTRKKTYYPARMGTRSRSLSYPLPPAYIIAGEDKTKQRTQDKRKSPRYIGEEIPDEENEQTATGEPFRLVTLSPQVTDKLPAS